MVWELKRIFVDDNAACTAFLDELSSDFVSLPLAVQSRNLAYRHRLEAIQKEWLRHLERQKELRGTGPSVPSVQPSQTMGARPAGASADQAAPPPPPQNQPPSDPHTLIAILMLIFKDLNVETLYWTLALLSLGGTLGQFVFYFSNHQKTFWALLLFLLFIPFHFGLTFGLLLK